MSESGVRELALFQELVFVFLDPIQQGIITKVAPGFLRLKPLMTIHFVNLELDQFFDGHGFILSNRVERPSRPERTRHHFTRSWH
jgi:hypothetical protein